MQLGSLSLDPQRNRCCKEMYSAGGANPREFVIFRNAKLCGRVVGRLY